MLHEVNGSEGWEKVGQKPVSFTAVHSNVQGGAGSEKSIYLRMGLVLACISAGAVACCLALGGQMSGHVELRELDLAHLPRFSPAALALTSSVKDTETLVNMAAKAHGDHALGNKVTDHILTPRLPFAAGKTVRFWG